ncbi:hypothetical protein HK105_208305 [Polyrhizophydium stewartii]|uniref:ABC transporter domain-containing protein n=1 Tax=Polyrhizophydium stewartii TaxID=2732419 RepID=A0ABR4MY64_9FUNG
MRVTATTAAKEGYSLDAAYRHLLTVAHGRDGCSNGLSLIDRSNNKQEDEKSGQIPVGKSRQITALAFKAVSFQKRQMFTNICCIRWVGSLCDANVLFVVFTKPSSLCPIFMISIAAGLGALITSLINQSISNTETIRCSNYDAMTSLRIPNWNSTQDIPQVARSPNWADATLPTLYATNYDIISSLSLSGPPGAASAFFQRPCVFWYGEKYPTSAIYERASGASDVYVRDATYTAEPLGGWIGALLTGLQAGTVNTRTLQLFIGLQQRSWAVYSAADSATLAALGTLSKPNNISVQTLLAQSSSPPFTTVSSGSNIGLFGTIPKRYWYDLNSISSASAGSSSTIGVQPVPWYEYSSGSDDDLDTYIGTALNSVIAEIAKVDKSALIGGGSRGSAAATELLIKIGKLLYAMPHGGIYFNKIDHTNRQYSWNYHFGTDTRLSGSSSFPAAGVRLLLQQTQLDNAILRNSNPATLGSASITQGLRIFPRVVSAGFNFPFGGLIGGILYPFGVSFLLPVFVVTLVQEKEYRVLVMMQMNGMKSIWYYASHYVTFYVLFAISSALFLIAGYVGGLTLFTLTQPGVYIVLFFLWVTAFLVVLLSVLISLTVDSIFTNGTTPAAYYIWPPFAFYRGLTVMNKASYTATLRPYRLSDLRLGDEVGNAVVAMSISIAVYGLITAYLAAIVPSEYGTPRPWHFPVTGLISAYRRWSSLRSGGPKNSEADLALSIQIDPEETKFEDADVKAERQRVLERKFDSSSPLILSHMRKVYAGRGGAGPKLAVKDVTFAVEEGVVFGLLGPNGAGKTTLISILTGLYSASSGEATIAGYNVNHETAEVYRHIGICPQFDILWEELTVGEHLYFYARLKGIPMSHEREAVRVALANVALTNFEDRLTKGLSGGEKRRLSIAIALLGSPKVVFFDEPTTGLDPEVRRLIWSIVDTAKQGKTVVLTTHSMEEAEALCQRIGIMAKGTLRCLANPIRLKQVYGSGFKIFFNTLEKDMEKAMKFVESILPGGYKIIDSFATNAAYEFPPTPGFLAQLFRQIEAHKADVGILDYGVGQTTLEEVFVRLISEADASAEY